MALVQPLGALVDPVDGVGRAVEARRWLLPLLLVAGCSAASGAAFALRWNAEPLVVAEIEKAGEMTNTTEQELASKIQQTERVALVGGIAKGLVGMPLAILLLAGFLKFLGWLLSRPAPFGGCFSAAAIAMLPIALYHLLFALVAVRAPVLASSQAATLVPSSLCALFHGSAPKWDRALATVDFFNLWAALLLGLGFAAAANLKRVRGVLWGLLLYAAYAAVFIVALPGLTQGGPK